VVQGVTEDKSAIGYSGIGYKTSGVRAVPLSAKPGGACVDDSPENVLSGKYPLARFLYVYVNKAPNKPADPLIREFVEYVLSQQGQQVVVKDGFIPLPNKIVQEELAKLQ
jgi:phosphate transport system substrate-binding protein